MRATVMRGPGWIPPGTANPGAVLLLVVLWAVSLWAQPPVLICDGIADNTAALNALVQPWAKVVLPVGTCNLSGQLILPDHPVTIEGAGSDQTHLVWTGYGGLQGTFSSPLSKQVILRDFSLVTTVPNGTAIDLNWPDDVWSGYLPTATIERVVIRGALNSSASWHTGIALEDAWNATIADVFINGGFPPSYNGFLMESAITLKKRTIAARISKVHTNWSNFGVYAQGAAEGLTIGDGSTFVGTRYGVYVTSDDQRPSLFLTHTHIAAITAGVVVERRTQALISGNLIYQWSGPVEGPFYGVLVLAGSEAATITQNTIMARADNPSATGIWVNPGSVGALVAQNTTQLVTQTLVNLGTNTMAQGNR